MSPNASSTNADYYDKEDADGSCGDFAEIYLLGGLQGTRRSEPDEKPNREPDRLNKLDPRVKSALAAHTECLKVSKPQLDQRPYGFSVTGPRERPKR
ncbi:hypothetical protein DL764_010668 [Monosporascus ibericus]|uniref:Uncharacterized protein n=1 Tax=Monosporascus ibericus TaxID=155417 RepID=A0A4Q4SSC2_9PEZI|nr:hypothetical protein DL764_010668 [Monosporascus ibericus]